MLACFLGRVSVSTPLSYLALAWLASTSAGSALGLLFAGFVGFSATQMLLDRKPQPGRQMPGALGAVAAP